MGVFTRLGESTAARFSQLGFNIGVLWPGQPACMYHREPNQEGFLIVAGECILFVEGEERHMKQWDYSHCPADTDHVMVATGTEPCVAVAVGSRASRDVVYPEFEPRAATAVPWRRRRRIRRRRTRGWKSATPRTRTAGSRISEPQKPSNRLLLGFLSFAFVRHASVWRAHALGRAPVRSSDRLAPRRSCGAPRQPDHADR